MAGREPFATEEERALSTERSAELSEKVNQVIPVQQLFRNCLCVMRLHTALYMASTSSAIVDVLECTHQPLLLEKQDAVHECCMIHVCEL